MNFKLNILTLLTATVGAAQVNFTNPDEGAVVSFQTTAIEPKETKTEGSPYFDENFKYGQVLVNGKVKTIGNLRYNAANSEIELQKGDKEYSAVLKRNYISARIDDKLYRLYPYLDDSNNETTRIGYFIPLNEGKIKLLYKPEKKLRRGRTGATNYDRTVPPRFIDISDYYIQKGEEPATKIYLRNKYFYDLLGKENIKDFIKKNDLRLNKEEDAIKVMQYINEEISTK
ncbi:hypothetical protein [Flagellimonas oceanensis]|uniref:hypothetical protein n=1 Tax=Flagellimonas oceanensis TaxID=2499163 RepID=UPI000F8F3CE2|nr:hypothetical protein [Allomuricauda oceanensis]|tara:strand:+ start:237 stop:923 length:687 start_codon:yes stop_codon:yes gene_type:complete